MRIKRITGLVVASFALICSIVGAGKVFADFDGLDSIMTISPPRQNIILNPGEDFEGSISVSSSSGAKNDLKYSVTIGSFSLGKDENGETDYNDTDVDTVTSFNQIMDWIELKKDNGTVKKGETDIIPFVIHVPKDAPGGGQYATIIVQDDTQDEMTPEGQSVSIVSKVRFAASIFAEVTGETEEKGEILENSIPSFLFNNKLSAVSRVRNNGNVHAQAKYTLQVWPLFSDEEICTNEEEPNEGIIMPDTERVHIEECDLPIVGIFRAKQVVEIFGEKTVVEKAIFVCPIWLLFGVIFVLFLLIMWLIMKTKVKK